MVIIRLENGRLCFECKQEDYNYRFSVCATKYGAKQAGSTLRVLGINDWVCAPSIDFPEDNQAPNLNFRKLIKESYYGE